MKKLLAGILVLCLMCSFFPVVSAGKKDSGLSPEEFGVLKIANQEREKLGLIPLTSLPELQRGGDIRSKELVSIPDHVRPDGSKWFTILDELQLPRYMWAGENVAAGQRSSEDVMNAWMNSPGHKANILNVGYVHMGAGYHYDEESIYGTFWVQLFYTSFSCDYTSMTVELYNDEPIFVGTALEDIEMIACLQCKSCGKSYLPVQASYCSGYDPNVAGVQRVTVKALGETATIDITVRSENGEDPTEAPTEATEPPTEPTEPPTEPPAPVENPFTDVKEGDYFATPVQWAVDKGITNGASANKFAPEKACTRGQIVTFLWRAAGCPEPQSTDNPFKDISSKAYYFKAVLWAVENGITTGTGKGNFSPDKTCTRGQVATFLWRAQGKPAPTKTDNPFGDIGDSEYYYTAVLWAVEQGVTTGTGKGKFAPGNDCTRGQIVTFLYRAMV